MGGIFWGSIVTLVDSITSGKCFLQNSGRHQRHRTDLKKGFHWHKDNFSFSMRSDNKEQRYPRFVQAPHSPLCKPSCQTCTWLRPLVCTRIFKLLHRLETFEQLHLNPALVIAARARREKILQSILLTIIYPSICNCSVFLRGHNRKISTIVFWEYFCFSLRIFLEQYSCSARWL